MHLRTTLMSGAVTNARSAFGACRWAQTSNRIKLITSYSGRGCNGHGCCCAIPAVNPGTLNTAVLCAQYYDIPRVSFRDLVWESMLRGRPGYNITELMEGDERHPKDFGHACVPSAKS